MIKYECDRCGIQFPPGRQAERNLRYNFDRQLLCLDEKECQKRFQEKWIARVRNDPT